MTVWSRARPGVMSSHMRWSRAKPCTSTTGGPSPTACHARDPPSTAHLPVRIEPGSLSMPRSCHRLHPATSIRGEQQISRCRLSFRRLCWRDKVAAGSVDEHRPDCASCDEGDAGERGVCRQRQPMLVGHRELRHEQDQHATADDGDAGDDGLVASRTALVCKCSKQHEYADETRTGGCDVAGRWVRRGCYEQRPSRRPEDCTDRACCAAAAPNEKGALAEEGVTAHVTEVLQQNAADEAHV